MTHKWRIGKSVKGSGRGLTRVKVTLQLMVYSQSVRLGAKPLENHDQRLFFEPNPYEVEVTLRLTVSQSVSQSVSKSWCRAPPGAHDQLHISIWQLRSCFFGGTLSDERTSLFCICCWPLPAQYFTVSDLRLSFSSPPTTRRVTVEAFDPASTREEPLRS
jgi:hypothetical protein